MERLTLCSVVEQYIHNSYDRSEEYLYKKSEDIICDIEYHCMKYPDADDDIEIEYLFQYYYDTRFDGRVIDIPEDEINDINAPYEENVVYIDIINDLPF